MKSKIYRRKKKTNTKEVFYIGGLLLLLLIVFITTSYIKMVDDIKACENPNKTLVLINTSKGEIEVEIDNYNMPITSENFLNLTKEKFYDNLTFHRYVAGFVIQGGDPTGTGMGGSNKTIALEINPKLTHEAGIIAMARKPDPNSATSQFYFTLGEAHNLDKDYAVFGKVSKGMDNVYKLRKGDIIHSIRIKEIMCNNI